MLGLWGQGYRVRVRVRICQDICGCVVVSDCTPI